MRRGRSGLQSPQKPSVAESGREDKIVKADADRSRARFSVWAPLAAIFLAVPEYVQAQSSPFMTGMTSLQTNVLAWLTPLAVILVMVMGAMAMANRVAWGWCIGAIFGIAIAFGAPQIVTWVRGMFGV